MISQECIDPVVLLLCCRVNDLNLRPNIDKNSRTVGRRIQDRIGNLVGEFHNRVAKWAYENYNTILLLKFQT